MERTCVACGFAGKTTWKRGLCNPCYCRAYKAGTLEKIANASRGPVAVAGTTAEETPSWIGNAVGYGAIHKRLNVRQGRAADKPCAEGCGRPARHWSYDGYCPGEKYDARRECPFCPHERHYQPRCYSCHGHWDKDQDTVAEVA